MSFKMKPPYKWDNTPVYEVPFDNPNLVAKANKNGTIIVNKDLATDDELMKEAMAHEKVHLKDMACGDLDYDKDSVTYKGKRYSRDSFDEGDETLPWEAPAYAQGKKGKEIDVTPKKEKLTGPPSMKDDTPLEFNNIGTSHEDREQDHDTVSMNEKFGTALLKKWFGPSKSRGFSGGTDEEAAKVRGEGEETEEERRARIAKENAEKEAEANLEADEGDDTSDTTTTVTEGEDEQGEYTETTTTTTTTTDFKGEGTDRQAWDENRNGVQGKYDSFEEFSKAAQAWRDKQKKKTETETKREYKKKPEDPKPEPKELSPRNIATLLNEYRIKNNVDMTYYDPEKPGGRGRHTPESYYKENQHFRDWVEAQQRKAVDAGEERLDETVYDDVNEGTNITKAPINMVRKFKKKPMRHLVEKVKEKINKEDSPSMERDPIKGYVYIKRGRRANDGPSKERKGVKGYVYIRKTNR